MKIYFIILILSCSGQVQSFGSADWFSELERLLSIGNVFLDAVERFEKFVKWSHGSVLVKIENYCSSTKLFNTNYYQIKGEIDQVRFDIEGGDKQALSASGSTFAQTEGLVGMHLPDSTWKIVAYWRVPFAWEGKPNKLGIGFVNSDDTGSAWLGNLVTSDSDVSLPMLGVKDFDKDLSAIQCCHDDLCVQGIMNSDQHCNMTVRILPRNASQLFHRYPNDQTLLNEELNRPNTCTSGGAKLSGSMSALLFMSVILTRI